MSTRKRTATKQYFNVTETANYLGISRQSVYEWIEKGRLTPAIRHYRACLFEEEHLISVKGMAAEQPSI